MPNAPVRPTPEQVAAFENVPPPPPPPPAPKRVIHVTETRISKGGQNPDNTSDQRPAPPQGSQSPSERQLDLMHNEKWRLAVQTARAGQMSVQIRRDKWHWVVEVADDFEKITISLQP